MDIFLGFAATALVFFLLLYASVSDVKTREVSNRVWVIGLLALPITLVRTIVNGLFPFYIIQNVLIFILVIIGYQLRMLGGADGKTILILSFVYPWIILDPVWIIIAPFVILLGGFLLVGIHSLILLIQNLITFRTNFNNHETESKPAKKRYWITRRFSNQTSETAQMKWKPVFIPLVLYFFLTYSIILILRIILCIFLG